MARKRLEKGQQNEPLKQKFLLTYSNDMLMRKQWVLMPPLQKKALERNVFNAMCIGY